MVEVDWRVSVAMTLGVVSDVGDDSFMEGLIGFEMVRGHCLVLGQRIVVFVSLLAVTLNHHESKSVDLSRMVIGDPLDDRAFLKVPNNQSSILRARSHEPIALADGDVDNYLFMSVETGL